MFVSIRKIIAFSGIFFSFAVFLSLFSCAHFANNTREDTGLVAMVSEGIYRGPRLNDYRALESIKVRTILNLEDDKQAVKREDEISRRLGMKMINVPMSGISRPKPADLLEAVKILENRNLHPVYVHCHHGCDRTGLVVAAYKILHDGWSVEKAYSDAVQNGHKWFLYGVILGWKESLRELSGDRGLRVHGSGLLVQ